MNLKLVAAFSVLADQDGVVEVAGGLSVDGDDGKRAKVSPAGGDVLVEVRDAAAFGQYCFRKDARELMLANHHFHVDAKIIR